MLIIIIAHAASAYYLSGFQDSAVLVIDAAGSPIELNVWETVSFGYAEQGTIEFFNRIAGRVYHRT